MRDILGVKEASLVSERWKASWNDWRTGTAMSMRISHWHIQTQICNHTKTHRQTQAHRHTDKQLSDTS